MFNFFVIVNKVLKNEILEKNLGLLKKDEICGRVFMKKNYYIICCYFLNNLKYFFIGFICIFFG